MAAAAYYVYTVTLEAGEPVQVPNIVNLPVEEAMTRLSTQGLELGKQEPVSHNTLPKGYIVSQRPAPGRVVRTGRKVYISYSVGKDFQIAEDMTNRYLDNVRELLESSTVRLGTVSRVPDSKPRNMVLAQDPPPGEDIEKGGLIHLLVSDGDGQYRNYMPDLRGKPVDDIAAIMAPYNVTLVAEEVDMAGAREDVVLDQNPQPDTLISDGQTITYKIKSSVPEPEVPAVALSASIRHEMRYDWYNRNVRIEQVDASGIRKVLETLPAATDDVSKTTRVVGSAITIPIQYFGSCRVDIYVDDVVVASYAVKDGEAPVRTTPQ